MSAHQDDDPHRRRARTLPGFGPDPDDPEAHSASIPKFAPPPYIDVPTYEDLPRQGSDPAVELLPPPLQAGGGPRPAPARRAPDSMRPAAVSNFPMPLEVLAVQDSISPRETLLPWVAVEVFTRNRLYRMNAMLRCVEVMDLATGQSDRRHDLIGAVLAGGQRRRDGGMEISRPFPWPGSDAVFEKRDPGKRAKFSRTSPVTRVVIRVQVLSVETENAEPTWLKMTGM